MQVLLKAVLQDLQTCLETSASEPRFSTSGKKIAYKQFNTPLPVLLQLVFLSWTATWATLCIPHAFDVIPDPYRITHKSF